MINYIYSVALFKNVFIFFLSNRDIKSIIDFPHSPKIIQTLAMNLELHIKNEIIYNLKKWMLQFLKPDYI